MTRSLCRRHLAMLRTTAQDCWSAGNGGSGEWRGPPATGEARETVDYRPFIGPLSTGDPATSRRPLAARAGDTGLSPPAWSHRVAKQWASASTAQYSKLSNVTSPEQGVRPPWFVAADERPQDVLRHCSKTGPVQQRARDSALADLSNNPATGVLVRVPGRRRPTCSFAVMMPDAQQGDPPVVCAHRCAGSVG